MKSLSLSLNSLLQKFLEEERNNTQRILFFGLFIPVIILMILIEWDVRVLVFIFLGYFSAIVGFILAKTEFTDSPVEDSPFSIKGNLLSDNLNDLVLIHDIPTRKCVFVSPSVISILGYNPEDLVELFDRKLIHPEDHSKFSKLINQEQLNWNPSFTTTLRILKKDGSMLWMEIRGSLCKNESEPQLSRKVILSMRDVTERKKVETATRQFAEELVLKKEKLQEEEIPMNHIASVVTSHEIREPLRIIRSYAHLLEKRYSNQLEAEGKECIHFLSESADRMQEMIDDVMAFTSMDQNANRFRKVELEELLTQVNCYLRHKIEEANAVILIDEMPTICADPRQLRHLFQNLIENAIKYCTAPQPEIHISIKSHLDHWFFSVKDNGIGIAPENQKVIFDLFRRLHGVGQFSGSGVGLALCKKIVDNHNGNIWVESDGQHMGGGSTFVFTIPKNLVAKNSYSEFQNHFNTAQLV